MLKTARLLLIPNTLELAQAQLHDFPRYCALLGVEAPADWPPPPFGREGMAWAAQQLEADPEGAGWYGWKLLQQTPDGHVLVGVAALVGRPDPEGEVEIGVGIVPGHAGAGFASEALRALVDWALDNGARRVIAHLDAEDEGARGAFAETGFANTRDDPYPGVELWALSAPLGRA